MATAKPSIAQPESQSRQKLCASCSWLFTPRNRKQIFCGKGNRCVHKPRPCVSCGEVSVPKDSVQIVCGKKDCQYKRYLQKRHEAAAQLRARVRPRHCGVCAKAYYPRLKKQTTCGSKKCRMKVSNDRMKRLRAQAIAQRPKKRCVICKRFFIWKRKDQVTCGRKECRVQRGANNLRKFYWHNREAFLKKQRDERDRLKNLAAEALAARAAMEERRIGRPRKDDIRELVLKARSEGKSWKQTQLFLNHVKRLNLSVGAVRGYAKNSP